MKLILASTSPYRRALLERLHYPFSCEAPGVDEERFKKQNLPPAELAALLAHQKALAVFRRFPDACVIGGDQVAALESTILSKPVTEDRAIEQLLQLQGKTHQLHTALHVLAPGFDCPLLETVSLQMRQLERQAIARYVAIDRPWDCAGSYKLEQHGVKLFTAITGGDQDTIVGMPLKSLQDILLKLGFKLFG